MKNLTEPITRKRKLGLKREPYKLNAPVVFPPCRVCGGKASGFHFGVISCEACKVLTNTFFFSYEYCIWKKKFYKSTVL